MRKINKKNIAGFMVIEAAFSIFIVGIALVAFLAVLGAMYKTEFGKRDYVVAANLAQEGIELVRNIRDNKWKAGSVDGFSGFPGGDYCVDYSGAGSNCANKLYRNDNTGLYTYDSTNAKITKFSRKIVISGSGETRVIKSSITWKPSGAVNNTTIEMEDTLYAWANPE
jgi:Tfp pilus assembly protein PilV